MVPPETIQKLQSECGIKLTMTGKDDTDSLGCFVQYRIGFYVAGDVGSLVHFFCFSTGTWRSKRSSSHGPPRKPMMEAYSFNSSPIKITFSFCRGWGNVGINLGFHDFYMATPFEVNIHPYLGVDVSDLAENMTYKPIKVFEPEKDLPLKWFECHPVIGNKLLSFQFEPDEDRTINLVITGNTWLCRFPC